MPPFDGPHRRLIEQDIPGAFFHTKGFHSALGIHQNTQDNGSVLSHLSRFEGIDWCRIVAVPRIAPGRAAPATTPASGTPTGRPGASRARAMNGAARARI